MAVLAERIVLCNNMQVAGKSIPQEGLDQEAAASAVEKLQSVPLQVLLAISLPSINIVICQCQQGYYPLLHVIFELCSPTKVA